MHGDNPFRYRIEGARLWITLLPGQWHDIEFSQGDRVQINSTTNVTHLKIHGHVSNIFLENSELENLNDSFSGTKNLESVEVRSSSVIKSMDDIFNGSGIINITIPTIDIETANRAFKDTDRIVNAVIESDKLISENEMFSGSNVSSVDSINSRPLENVVDIFKDTKNFKIIGEIDLSMSASDDKRIVNLNNESMASLDIMVSRGKILLKKYEQVHDNVIDDDMNIEIDVKPILISNTRDEIIINSAEGEDFDDSMNIEVDVTTLPLPLSRDKLVVDLGDMDPNFNETMNVEIDVNQKNDNITHARRDDVHIATGLDTSVDENMVIEVDIVAEEKIIETIRRDSIRLDTDLDNTSNDEYNLECDIVTVISDNLVTARRSPLIIKNGLSTDTDEAMTFECDIGTGSVSAPLVRRDSIIVETGMDSVSDVSSYNIEIDVETTVDNIDPLDDGSCVYYASRNLDMDLVSGDMYPAREASSLSDRTVSVLGKAFAMPTRRVISSPIASASVGAAINRNMYFRFQFTPGYGTSAYIYTLIDSHPSTMVAVTYSLNRTGYFQLKVSILGVTSNPTQVYNINIQEEFKVYPSSGNGYSFAMIESTVQDEYHILVSGEIVKTFNVGEIGAIGENSRITLGGSYASSLSKVRAGYLQAFNRRLTVEDVQKLDRQ
jgi:hypothetical protein